MSADSPPNPSTTGHIDVLLVDNWLVFDCPGCDQTIKIDRENATLEIQCPACELGFAPLLKSGSPTDASDPTTGQRSVRPLSRRMAPDSAPLAEDLPQEGQITLEIALSTVKLPTSNGSPPAPRGSARPTSGRLPQTRNERQEAFNPVASNLPVRSEDDLESRRLAVAPLHPPSKADEDFSSMIEEGGSGQYKRIRVRTRKKRPNEKQKALRFYFLAGLASLLLAAGAFYLASLAAQKSDKAEKEAVTQTVASPAQPQGPIIKDWKVLIQRMIEAENADDFLNIVRKPKRVQKRMAAYYAEGNPHADILDATLEAPAFSKDLPSGFRRGRLQLSGSSMIFYLEDTPSHGYRLDWESFVGAGSMSWEDFRAERTTTPQRMRVVASLADYYEGLHEENRYQSVRLEDSTGKHALYTYLRRSSPTDRDFLERLIGKDLSQGTSQTLQVVLDIRFPPDAANDVQVEIEEYVSDRWLIP